MIFTTKAEYGVRLLIQLGLRSASGPVSLKAVAAAENLPLAYLERIAALLKKAELVEATRGGVHYSFEAIGNKGAVEQSFAMLRTGGTATMIGLPAAGTKIELDSFHLFYERKIQGSMMGSNRFPTDMPRLIELYMQGRLHLDELISRRIKLEQVNEALEELKTGQLARSVIQFDA